MVLKINRKWSTQLNFALFFSNKHKCTMYIFLHRCSNYSQDKVYHRRSRRNRSKRSIYGYKMRYGRRWGVSIHAEKSLSHYYQIQRNMIVVTVFSFWTERTSIRFIVSKKTVTTIIFLLIWKDFGRFIDRRRLMSNYNV